MKRKRKIRCSARLRSAQLVRLCLLGFSALLASNSDAAQRTSSGEYEVKAAFLYHFAEFVDWPPDAFKNETSPLTYCTFGEDPFQGGLEASLAGKTIGARPLRVRHVKQLQEIPECQILFIAASQKKRITAILASVKTAPVLTVADSDHFVNEGGVIGFLAEEKKIRFEINLKAATDARLRISAKLLALAETVIGDPRVN